MGQVKEPENPFQMKTLSNEQKELLMYQRNEELARANLIEMQRLLQSSLIAQGKFDDAKKEGVKAKEITPIVKAIEKDDSARCKCPTPNFQVIGQRIWSDAHSAFVMPQRCMNCGFENAVPELIQS